MVQEKHLSAQQRTRSSVILPVGFRAVGVHCGIKKVKKDLGLIVSDFPASAGAIFTQNKVQAAPVVLSKEHFSKNKTFRAIVVNSGNANACTGERGYEHARMMAESTAAVLGVDPSEIFVASTGVIGEPLPIAKVQHGICLASAALGDHSHESVVEAIMTTDTFPKSASASLRIDGRNVHIYGISKGSGMIHPNMATMLGFITTDATIEPEVLQSLLKETADKTFNRIVVDGDTSTNEMVIALANGQSGIAPLQPGTSSFELFSRELEALMKKLALDIVRDGEGATKLVEVRVEGALTDDDAVKAAKTIALSPLVKTAIHGEDANWGRIIAAVGYSGIEFDPALCEIVINSAPILQQKFNVTLSNKQANESLKPDFIELVVSLHDGSGAATVWTCDFSEEYVVINGSYRS